jgi:hypothetical protein
MNSTSPSQVGEQRREIARLGDHRAGRGAEADAQFARDDLRQRRLAEAGRAEEQHMIQRLAARFRAASMKMRRFSRAAFWPDEFGLERLRAQRGVLDEAACSLCTIKK